MYAGNTVINIAAYRGLLELANIEPQNCIYKKDFVLFERV